MVALRLWIVYVLWCDALICGTEFRFYSLARIVELDAWLRLRKQESDVPVSAFLMKNNISGGHRETLSGYLDYLL
jgi:hypothetical protein